MKIAWGITGAGHFLKESFEAFRKLKHAKPGIKVSIFVSGAAEEVLRMYGLFDLLVSIAPGGYMEEIFLERDQGKSYPKAGRFLLGKYHCLVVSPATSNTVSKIAHGIADTLVTNAVTQAVKGGVPVYLVPVDVAGVVRSELPYNIEREICMDCEDWTVCPPKQNCPRKAIKEGPQIDLLSCDGCSLCIEFCKYGAIKGGEVELKVRDLDSKNVQALRGLDEITVLDKPNNLLDIL